ncbi:MAG: FtsQ-type POTRA domain-containing protein [Clostridia bacterium]
MARRKISNRLRKKRRRRIRIFLLFTFVILIISLLTYSISIFFKIKEIEVIGATKHSSTEIVNNIDIDIDDSLIFFDKSKIKDAILQKYPYVDTVNISRQYPDKLQIEITECEEFATIYYAATHYAISEKGKILSSITMDRVENLPKIIGFEPVNLEIGQYIESDEPYKEQVLSEIFQIFIDYGYINIVTEIDITKTYDIIIKCGTKYQLEIGSIDDIDHKMKMFEEVIKKLTPSDTVIINLGEKSYARFRNEEISPSIYP